MPTAMSPEALAAAMKTSNVFRNDVDIPAKEKSLDTCPKPTYPIETAGSFEFSSLAFVGGVVGIAGWFTFTLGLPLWAWVTLSAVIALPGFAAYMMASSRLAVRQRPGKRAYPLPRKPITDYLTFQEASMAATYTGLNKIPMETFFEAYFDEKVDINMDMLELLESRHDWAVFGFTWSQVKFFLTQWIPETLSHTRNQDVEQVTDHYDRGNDFYNWFLGPRMIYTSGIIRDTEGRETLEELQDNKLKLVCDKIQLKPNQKMLDIGCGWGTLGIYAAKNFNADVTCVTLAKEQIKYATGEAAKVGVTDNLNLLCMDYRDIPTQTFDKITCLEMAEHVGVRKFQTFLCQVRDMLDDDGLFFLQIAGLRRRWQYEDFTWGLFMAKYVFPGADASMPLGWVITQLEKAGFEVLSNDTIGVHYAATLERWYMNWVRNKEQVVAKYGVSWWRKWEYFLAYSTVAARQGSATCYQLVCHKNLNGFDRTGLISEKRLSA